MNDMISIIIPVYNGKLYLAEAIESCLNQTYSNFELIIVNDCSTDTTLKIAEKYALDDRRISILSNEVNKKLPASLNIGHKRARGNYLTWTSHDNILKGNMLELLVHAIQETKADLVFSDYDVIEANGAYRRTHHFGPVCNLPFGSCIGASFLYSKELFAGLGGYDETLHLLEDYDFWLRAALKYRFFHLKKTLYKYRVHTDNLTYKISNDLFFQNSFKDKHSSVYSKLLNQLNGSEKTTYFLMMVRGFEKWNWDIFKKYQIEIIDDLRAFQKLINSNDGQKTLDGLDAVLRNKIISEPSNKITIRWLFFHRPGIIFNRNYSKRNSLNILKRMF